jgi:hypothetical protein
LVSGIAAKFVAAESAKPFMESGLGSNPRRGTINLAGNQVLRQREIEGRSTCGYRNISAAARIRLSVVASGQSCDWSQLARWIASGERKGTAG